MDATEIQRQCAAHGAYSARLLHERSMLLDVELDCCRFHRHRVEV